MQRARDQREVAFGLAALSTKQEIHYNILKKGGVKTLTHLLKSSYDVEAQRFAALAIANTACIENEKIEFIREDECLDGILSELRNDDSDTTVRQYCAMALANLATDHETHVQISDCGGLFAITYFLKVVAKEKYLDAARYATVAISNLAINPNHRHKFIQYGAIESLVCIACWDDWTVQCKALEALRAICMSHELRIVVINAGVLDPLVIMSKSDHRSVLYEVAAVFHCLSTVPEKKNEISDRALSTIISLLFVQNKVIELHASSTIANLTEESSMHHRFFLESGLYQILSLYKTYHVDSKVEVMRTLSNLSGNRESHSQLLSVDVLKTAVEALGTSEVNCQTFAASLLANLTVDVASHALIIREGIIGPLINMARGDGSCMEAQRYAALTLANISFTRESHHVIVDALGIETLLMLCNLMDTFSQKNVACSFANFASNAKIHSYIMKTGVLHSISFLGQNKDLGVRSHVSAALRGLSVDADISIRIVQEGGLAILLPLLSSNDIVILRNATACLYNLSLITEHKIEISQVGCIPLLTRLIQYNDDSEVSSNCCACLSIIAEMSCHQVLIASDGGIMACLVAMRSKFLELQRKGSRLFSLLCACDSKRILNEIIEKEGHNFLISYLTSHDSYLLQSGVLGILNLSAHKDYRLHIAKARVIDPLVTLIRYDDLNTELQNMAMMCIVNLSEDINNHRTFVNEGMVKIMISIYNSSGDDMRTYAALVVANVAKNRSMSQIISCCQGGVESILHLARLDYSQFRRNVLGAIASLSFIQRNKEQMCFEGGSIQLFQAFRTEFKDSMSLNSACCAIANLSENAEYNAFLAEMGVVPLLTNVLTSYEFDDINEAIRALGNLAINPHLCLGISQNIHVINKVLKVLISGNEYNERMAYMMMTNVAASTETHDYLARVNIMSAIMNYLQNALIPKHKDSDETISYALLLIANLWANKDNHNMISKKSTDLVIQYTKHRDVRCRQNAVICLGNLCSQPNATIRRWIITEVPQIFISFAYSPSHTETYYAQFQAIGGIRGLAFHHDLRCMLVQQGCCEPLVLTLTRDRDKTTRIALCREVSAAIFNLTLSSSTYLLLVQSGIVSGLSSLIEHRDTVAQTFAIGSLANLARYGYEENCNLFAEVSLPMFRNILESFLVSDETTKELARCLVHFARDVRCSQLFERHYEVLEHILSNLITKDEMISCQMHSLLSYANLAMNVEQKLFFFLPKLLKNIHLLMTSTNNNWISRCAAYALNNICKYPLTHDTCENFGVPHLISQILSKDDKISNWHACIALKYFSVHTKGATKFVECDGLVYLFRILNTDEHELRLEALTCLRNLSIPEMNKINFRRKGDMAILVHLMKSAHTEVTCRACSVAANLAECDECQQKLIEAGILHQLKFSMGSNCHELDCEALRLISAISSGSMCIRLAENFSLLILLTQFFSSESKLCRRYACLATANLLGSSEETRQRLVEKGVIHSLVSEIRHGQDEMTKQYALIALSNISEDKQYHHLLCRSNIIELTYDFLTKNDEDFTYSAALCLSNLASNVENHPMLHGAGSLDSIKLLLNDSNSNLILLALSFVRGASASGVMVKDLFHPDIGAHLLKHAHAEVREIQIEIISSLCNMSLSGIIEDDPKYFLQHIDMNTLLSFLHDGEPAFYLYAAIMIGNLSSDYDLQETIISTGVLDTILRTINKSNSESRRCMAYALCNLSCSNRIAREKLFFSDAGLSSILSLGYLGNENDLYISVSTIRELSSCSEFRKIIVDNKGLDSLFQVYENYGNLECLREAVQALCLLSLDDDNKVHIVQHNILQQVFSMTLLDNNEISSLSLRTLANCCEIDSLNGIVLKYIDKHFFHQVATGVGAHEMELSRFICNISSVRDHQANLLRTNHMMNIILQLFSRDCSVINTNVSMTLLNFSANREIHEKLCAFGDKIVQSVLRIFECNTRSTAAHYFLCISVGHLIVNNKFHKLFLVSGLTDLLIKLLVQDDYQLRFQATCAFHHFVREKEGQIIFKDATPDISLINVIIGLDAKHSFHAISSLRYLSIEPDNARNIVENNGLQAIIHASYRADDSMKREISHLFCHLSCVPDLRYPVLKSDGFMWLIKMLEKTTSNCSCLILTALANCLEDPSLLPHLQCFEHTVKMVLQRMNDNILCVKREAYRVFTHLLSCDKVIVIATLANVFRIISLADISRNHHLINLSISMSLRKLSSISSCQEFIVHHAEAMKMICHFCHKKNNKDTIVHAGYALKNLSTLHQMKELIATKGGIAAALNLLEHECQEINVLAVAVLYHLSFLSKITSRLYNEDVFSLVCNHILNANLMDSFCYTSLLFSNLAEHVEVREFMWKDNVISALKKLGSLNSSITLLGVSRCILFMSMMANVITDDFNIIRELMDIAGKLLYSENRQVANNAAALFGNVAEHRYRNVLIKESNILEPLLNLAQTAKNYRDDSLICCWALSKMFICMEKESAVFYDLSVLLECLTDCVLSKKNADSYVSMVLCNLSAVDSSHEKFLKLGWIPILISLLLTTNSHTVEITLKTLCNLSKSDMIRKEVVNCSGIKVLLELVKYDTKHHALVALILCEIVINQECKNAVIALGGLDHYTKIICKLNEPEKVEACWMLFHRMSRYYDFHKYLINTSVLRATYEVLKDGNERDKLMALLTFCNLAANDAARRALLNYGAFDFVACCMNKKASPVERNLGTLLMGNLVCNLYSEHQNYLHRAIKVILTLLSSEDSIVHKSAMVSLINMTHHSSNLSEELHADIAASLRKMGHNDGFMDMLPYISFNFANLASNRKASEIAGENSGIEFIANMISSTNNFYCRWVGISAIKNLTQTRRNIGWITTRSLLNIIMSDSNLHDRFIQSEVSACILNLSQGNDHRPVLAEICMPGLLILLGTKDRDTIRRTCDTIALLVTESDNLICLDTKHHVIDCTMPLLQHENLTVRRASSRLMSDLLSCHEIQIRYDQICSLVNMLYDHDCECRRHASSACSKLAVKKESHPLMMKNLPSLIQLTHSKDEESKTNAIITVQALSTEEINRAHLVEGCVVQTLSNFILYRDHNIQVAVLSTLENLSLCPAIKNKVFSADVMIKMKTIMGVASHDLCLIIIRLIANLSEDDDNRFNMINVGIVSAAFPLSKNTCPRIQEVSFNSPYFSVVVVGYI